MVNYLDRVIDVIFAIDIFIMFRTSYKDPKRDIMIDDSKKIALNYLKGRFFIDLLASFPFEFFIKIIDKHFDYSKAGNLF